MIPEDLRKKLAQRILSTDHPAELAIDVMFSLQKHYSYLSDEAVYEAADILGMTPLEIEEIATFYDFIYREPVGKFVIHACDGVVCWMFGEESVVAYLCRKLNVEIGEVTADGMFTVLPTACIGYCDHAPAMLVNGVPYGLLTPEKIDQLLERLKTEHSAMVPDR
jgi:NADH-quinone oxidoreductase subunit E